MVSHKLARRAFESEAGTRTEDRRCEGDSIVDEAFSSLIFLPLRKGDHPGDPLLLALLGSLASTDHTRDDRLRTSCDGVAGVFVAMVSGRIRLAIINLERTSPARFRLFKRCQ